MSNKKDNGVLFSKGQYVLDGERYRVVIHVPSDVLADAFAKSYMKVHLRSAKKNAS